MQLSLLLISLIVLFVYMTVWFAIAYKRKRLDTVDTAWGGGFVAVALTVAIAEPNNRTLMVALLVALWGGRLFWHLLKRSSSGQEDPRYVKMASKWKNVWLRAYFSIFMTQGLLIALVGLPIIFASGEVIRQYAWLFTAGYFVWVAGFYIEYKADKQLAAFKRDPANKGKLLNVGLWRYSRHPNYFGELLQWWGIGLIALQTSWGWIGLFGPLLLTILIRYVSGVPTVEKPKADNPAYRRYQQQTSPIIPWFVDESKPAKKS